MNIDLPGRLARFEDLDAGDFFAFIADDKVHYGIKIWSEAEDIAAAVDLFGSSRARVKPPAYLSARFFLNKPVFRTPGARIKPDLATMNEGWPDNRDRGVLILSDNELLMQASFAQDTGMHFCVADGLVRRPASPARAVWFSGWTITNVAEGAKDEVLCSFAAEQEPALQPV